MNRRSQSAKKASRGRSASQPTADSGRRGNRKAATQAEEAAPSSDEEEEQPQEPQPRRGKRGQTQSKLSDFFEQSSSSQSQQKASKIPPISEEEVLDQARNVAFFLLGCVKEGNCVSRSEVQKNVLKNFHSRHYLRIMAATAALLAEVFGLEIVSFDGENTFDKMVLIDKQGVHKQATTKEEDKASQALLLLLVSCIHVAGAPIREEEMIDYLRELRISYSKSDPHFGDVEAKLNSFKSQSYLKFETDRSTTPPTKLIGLGPRADAEINRAELMAFSKRLYPDLAFLADNSPDRRLCDSQDEEEEFE
ncbi:melanoma-associated antigen B18-like [Cloeon dipterum]|uniref:melanoma-associated antigen B18-like n=1 Tax=Cloeon dipterum TaxID=197152 RepID=UPI00321FB239